MWAQKNGENEKKKKVFYFKIREIRLPSAGLPYLITYVQNEAPVLSCVHLTGCFLCREDTKHVIKAEIQWNILFYLCFIEEGMKERFC